MILGDYAPPASPSLEQQRDALQKGLGRAVQWAFSGRLHDEALLEACLRDQRFDMSAEDPRGDWLWEIVQAISAADRFRVPILHAFYELSDERSAVQLCELARCYGATGDEAFRSRLYEVLEQKPFPDYDACLGEEDVIALDAEQGFLFAARLRGQSLGDRTWEWHDRAVLDFAVKRLGEEKISSLLETSSDAAIRRFRDSWGHDESEKTRQEQAISYREELASISVAEIIRQAESENSYSRFRGWGRQANQADLRLILQRLRAEREPPVLVNLLKIFSARALPDFDVRLIELCKHGAEDVRRRALWRFRVKYPSANP